MKNNATGRFNANSLPVLTVCLVTNSVTLGLVTRTGTLRWEGDLELGCLSPPRRLEPHLRAHLQVPGGRVRGFVSCLESLGFL